MKRVSFAMFCGLLLILATGVAIFSQANAETEIATQKLIVTLRLLNTSEYSYRGENGRFANWEELLGFLRRNGYKREVVIDLENPKPYELENHHKQSWRALPDYGEADARHERQEHMVQNSSFQ